MIDFIVKLEDMLRLAGYEDYELIYSPEHNCYLLKIMLNGTKISAIIMKIEYSLEMAIDKCNEKDEKENDNT